MAAITSDIAAQFALVDEARIYDLDWHTSPAFHKLRFGTLLRSLLDVAQTLDDSFDSISGTQPNWGAGVADIAALKLVTAANRADKQSRVVESNGLGGESIYIYDLQSTADADDVNVVTPTDDSTGRWLLAYQNGTLQLPVINKTGAPLTKGTPCYIAGWDVTAGKLKVATADAADGTKAANGILGANLADNAQGVLLCGETTISSLDTSGASAADTPVYLKSGGGLAYTTPTTGYVQEIGVVQVKHGSAGKIRVNIKPMRVPPAATTAVPGLMSAGDKTRLGNTLLTADKEIAAASQTAGSTQSGFIPWRAPCAGTVVGVYCTPSATPTVAPAANPNDLVVSVNRTGAGSIASKTYDDAV